MGEVVRFAKDGEEQFIVQPYGWEKGTMVKGKWEGEYESLTILTSSTIYRKGTCKNGKLDGEFNETITFHAEEGVGEATFILGGKYIEGKKEGGFTQYRNGNKYSMAWYEDNNRVFEKKYDF